MNGKKPVTKEYISELLDRPEAAELRARLDARPGYRACVIEMVVKIANVFDSAEDFLTALEVYQKKKGVSA